METLIAYNTTTSASGPVFYIAITALALAGLSVLLSARKYTQEPPFLPSNIPLLGHLVPMFRKGAPYYTELYQQYHQGLYTLPIFRYRMYMISSPDWVPAVYKSSKTISFNALVAPAMRKVFGFDEASMSIMQKNMNDERGDRTGVLNATHDMIVKTMAPGPHLDELNQSFLDEMAPHVNPLARNGGGEKIKLWSWIRHHFSLASAAAIYGPQNPFALNAALADDFWEFEQCIGQLVLLPYPSIFARKAELARKRVRDGMIEYAEREGWKEASQVARNRAELVLGHGLSTRMYGVGEVSMLFAVLANTVPAAFWLLSYIFADPQLLADVRAEVDGCVCDGEGKGKKCIINATKLKTECPLFFSTMRETLRLIAAMNINRYILEDTTVTNPTTRETFLLKKGSLLQVAANVIHNMPAIYGEDVDAFNARRFMSKEGKTIGDPAGAFRDEKGKIHAGSFRAFGGGNNVCPGRQFAQVEMQALAAVFVAGFEIDSEHGEQYVPPPFEDKKMPVAQGLIHPGMDVEVLVRRREGLEGVEWGFEM